MVYTLNDGALSPSVSFDSFSKSVNAMSSAMSCLDRQVPLILTTALY